MVSRFCSSHFLAVAAFSVLAASAHAQSNYIDLSKPMTGKSAYVFNHDGTPVELGARAAENPQPKAPPAADQATWTGAAAVQEPPAESVAMAGRQRVERRRGGTTLVAVGASRQAEEKKARPQQKTRTRIGRRRR